MLPTSPRPGRFRPILTSVLVLLCLLVLWIGMEVYFAITAVPHPVTDYGERIALLVAESQAGREGEDAWPLLLEATALLREAEAAAFADFAPDVQGAQYLEYETIYDFENMRSGIEERAFDVEEELASLELQRALTLATVEGLEAAGVLDRLERVASSGRGVMPMIDSREQFLFTMLLPHLGEQRNLAKALKGRMHLAREAGDWEAYTESFEYMLAIGRLTGEQGVLIQRLVGIAIRALAMGTVTQDISAGRVAPEALDGIREAFERQVTMSPMEYALRAELMMQLDAVQWTHTKRGRVILTEVGQLAEISWNPGGFTGRPPKIVNVASIVFPRKGTTEAWFRDYTDFHIELSRLTPAERRGTLYPMEYEEMSWREPLQSAITPALGRALSTDSQDQLYADGLRTLLAIERYRRDEGGLPDSLESLVPEYLPEVPLDRYAKNGEPLGYAVFEEPDASGREYLLYTVGLDGMDNGGEIREKNVYDALNSPNAEGTDFVLNRVGDE